MTVPPSVWVENLGSAVRYSAIDEIPELVVRIVDEEIWPEFESKMGTKRNASFEEFVTSPPLQGINTTVETLKRLCANNTAALNAIDRALQRPVGGDRRSEDFKDRNTGAETPRDGTRAQALRKLRADRPDLHEQVLADEMSPHAAMVQAGFRPRTFTVRADDPAHIARTLQRRLDPEAIKELRRLLEDIA